MWFSMGHRPFSIELTPEEATLAEQIKFDPHDCLGDTKLFHANGDLVVQLTNSLLARKVIPDQRLSYFSDPEYNVGGRGSSLQELFLRKTGDREKMVRHGHFLKYLHYFIHGADLPARVIDSFSKAVEDCGPITSGDITPLSSAARQLARTHNLNPKVGAEEFYKLCLDLGLSPSNAASIRSSVLQIRR